MLGYIGYFYMLILILLLIIGFGSISLGLLNYVFTNDKRKNTKKM